MKKVLTYFLLGTITSFYMFPVSFTFLPTSLNTKMMLAVIGVALFGIKCMSNNRLTISQHFLGSIFFSLLFSLSCYLSVVLNDTSDYTYAKYFMSFFTWMAGAYAVCFFINYYHGDVSLKLITKYLVWVSVVQCVSAILIDTFPTVQNIVDSVIEQSQEFLKQKKRLYGLGASLDNAGVRFTFIQVLLAHQLCFNKEDNQNAFNVKYIIALMVIIILGNMISRTTSVGALLALGYLTVYRFFISGNEVSKSQISFIFAFMAIVGIGLIIVSVLYNTSVDFHNNMRFAFEGFFNWVETGVWRTDSTDKLNGVMWVWPTDLKSWIVGTGLIDHYVYGTDIGYCRFILYCGIIGFSIFSAFFVYHAYIVAQYFDKAKLLAIVLLATTFIIWIKVSTDIFCLYALLLSAIALRPENSEDYEEADEIIIVEE